MKTYTIVERPTYCQDINIRENVSDKLDRMACTNIECRIIIIMFRKYNLTSLDRFDPGLCKNSLINVRFLMEVKVWHELERM